MPITDWGLIVKGGEYARTVVLTDSNGWAVGSDSWTWKALIASEDARSTATLSITATSATISTVTDSDDTMTLVFDLTNANTDSLTAGLLYYVEVEAAEGDATEHYYRGTDASPIHGWFVVKAPEGGG